jgi:hypothetical protein
MALVLTHSYSYPLIKPYEIAQSLRNFTGTVSLAHCYSTRLPGFTTLSFQTKMGDYNLATTVSTHAHAHTIVFTPDPRSNRSPHRLTSNSSLCAHERTILNFVHTTVTFQSYLVLVANNKHPTLLGRELLFATRSISF